MSLLQKIKFDQQDLRRQKITRKYDPQLDQKIALLTTLYAEAARTGNDDGKRESTDDEVIATIKKFLKNANETIRIKHSIRLEYEIDTLSGYLPRQMTEERIREVVVKLNATNIGQVMQHFKADYGGRYDGGVVSRIAREIL
jgi:hypothetical protein